MPKRTIYVRDADEEVWAKAQKMAGESLSGLLADMLRKYVENQEVSKEGMGRVELEIFNRSEAGRKVAFRGRELCYTQESSVTTTAYLTEKGKFLFFVDLNYEAYYRVYDTLEDAAEHFDASFLAEVAEASGTEYVEDLDV